MRDRSLIGTTLILAAAVAVGLQGSKITRTGPSPLRRGWLHGQVGQRREADAR